MIGSGAICREISQAIDAGAVSAELTAICDVDRERAETVAKGLRRAVQVRDRAQVIRTSDLVVEAVSAQVAPSLIRETLAASKDVPIMSVALLLQHNDDLRGMAKRTDRQIYLPSGTIGDLGAGKAPLLGGISSVTLTTRKPPKGLMGAPYVVEHHTTWIGWCGSTR